MSRLFCIVAALTLFADVQAQTAATEFRRPSKQPEADAARSIADCNAVANSSIAKRRNFRACETLEKDGRLSLVDPAALTAFRRYQEERLRECRERQASPRGMSRGLECAQ